MSSIYSGIKKVNPVGPTQKSNTTHTPPKQHSHIPPDKKPEKKKDKDSLVDIYAEESDSSNFQHRIKNIIGMNPKGSAAEQILLGKFLGSDQGAYARNVLGKNHKGWIEHIATWLKKNQPRLQKEFTETDFSDLESLAYDMYENYLAKQGQLEEGDAPPKAGFNPRPMKKGEGNSPDDYEYTEFIPRGKEASEKWAIKQTIAKQKLKKEKPKELNTGFYKNYLGNRPIREEGQALDTVTSAIVNYVRKNKMHLLKKHGVRSVIAGIQDIARQHSDTPEKSLSDVNIWAKELENMLDRGKYHQIGEGKVAPLYPLVIAGHPFDWNVYDLRNNKMVANVLGGDRSQSKLYEIRIRSSGMTPTTRMKPTYVLTAGAHDKPPYKAYELVEPEGGFGKIEKSPGPGGTTKLRPDQDDVLRHFFKTLGGGRYYGYDLNLVEKGLNQWDLIEKALGAKIMDVDTANELGYTDWDPNDSSGIIYLGNQKNEGYSAGAVGGAGIDEGNLSKTLGALALGTLGAVNAQAHTDTTKSVDQLAKERPALAQRLKDIGATGQVPASDIRARELQKKQDQELPASERRARELEKLQQPNMEEGQIYSTGGGPGQGYHWYKPTPAGLKETDMDKKYESAVMKGLQSEETHTDKQLRRQKRSQEIDAQIQKAYPYLVRNAKTGLEKEFMSMDDAIAFAKRESARSLDSATVVYDRNSKFPVTAYRGSEEVYAKPNVHEGDVVRGPNRWFIRNPNKAVRIDVDYPNYDPSIDNNLLPYVKKPEKPQASNVSQLPPVPQFKLLDLYKQFTTSPQYRKGYHKGMSDDEFETMASEFIEQKLGTVKPAILGQYTEKFLQLHKTVQDTHKGLKEYGEVDTKRIIKFSKENPPDLDYLYQQFIQKMLSPDNNLDPNDWIKKVNEFYGLNYTWKDYQNKGHKDHTNNWQKIIDKYILKR